MDEYTRECLLLEVDRSIKACDVVELVSEVMLRSMTELVVDPEMEMLAAKLMADGGFPVGAEVDALHVAIAAVQRIELLLTWNCRHINNAQKKPLMRSICAAAGYTCPEICTPQELLPEDIDEIPG